MIPETMDALVKPNREKGLVLERRPVPSPGMGEVLIRIHKTAICGTDVHIYNWDPWSEKNIVPPMIVGHEYVGVIAALGAGVTGYKIGAARVRRGSYSMRTLPQLQVGQWPVVQTCKGRGCKPRGRFCRIPLHTGNQCNTR